VDFDFINDSLDTACATDCDCVLSLWDDVLNPVGVTDAGTWFFSSSPLNALNYATAPFDSDFNSLSPAAGLYFMMATIDFFDTVAEYSESNNSIIWPMILE
jgi:hypothetical protein